MARTTLQPAFSSQPQLLLYVGLEPSNLGLEVGLQHPGVDVHQVPEAEHLRGVHEVLPVLQLGEEPLLPRDPAHHQVLLHADQLLPHLHHGRHLVDDGAQGRVQLLEVDERPPGHEGEVLQRRLAHRHRAEVPVVDDPGGGGRGGAPVALVAVVAPRVVAEAGGGELGELQLALQTPELLLRQAQLGADGQLQRAVPEPGRGVGLGLGEEGGHAPPPDLGDAVRVHEEAAAGAAVDGLHQVPERAAALAAEEHAAGGRDVVTRHHQVARTLLLTRQLK